MENMSSFESSDDNASVIICIDTDNDEFVEQEMEITSSDVVVKVLDDLVQTEEHLSEPDSTSKVLETSQIIQTEKVYLNKKDTIEITSNNTSTSSPSEDKDLFNTDPDSSNTEKTIPIPMTKPNDECEVQILEERIIKKDLFNTDPDSSNTEKTIPIPMTEPNDECEVQILEERIIKKGRPFNIPRNILQNMIAKAIISSVNGFLSIEEIMKCLLLSVHCRRDQMGRMRNLIISTLESNADVFMSHIIKKENYPKPTFESGYWTLHPLAAAKFVYCDTLGKDSFKEQKQVCIEALLLPGQEIIKNNIAKVLKKSGAEADMDHTTSRKSGKPSVAMKRSSKLDFWATKNKVAKIDDTTMIIPVPDVINTLKNFGISFEMKWEGWSAPDRTQENKISKLEEIIKNSTEPVTSGISKGLKKQNMHEMLTASVNLQTKSLLLKNKGVKRHRSSDSDVDSSDNETRSDESIVHKEHNYVAIKDASASRNLIENLRKIVKKMDKTGSNHKNHDQEPLCTKNEDEEEDFLGFDYDLLSGYWRGWEKASSKNAVKMKEIAISQEGSRELEEVLKESDLAVSKFIESKLLGFSNIHDQINIQGENSDSSTELESCERLRNKKLDSPKTCDLEATIEKSLKELISLFDNTEEEPPMSYLELTVMAICASPEPALTTEEICHFIQQHFPFHRGMGLLCVVDELLRLQSPTTFTCHKSRKLTNPATCWKVDVDSACGILERALNSAKSRIKTTRSPQKTGKDRLDNHDPLLRGLEIEDNPQQDVVVGKNSLKSSKKISQIKNYFKKGEKHSSMTGHTSKYQESICDVTPKSASVKVPSTVSSKNKAINNVQKLAIVSPISVISSVEPQFELMKKHINPSSLVKKVESSSPEKVNSIKSSCNYPAIFKEDQELEIIDVDPSLQDKENSNFSSEDDDVIVIDEDSDAEKHHNSFNGQHERLFGCKQSSIGNDSFIEVCDKTSCSFLHSCRNLDLEIKKYPCYICHKFYGSDENLNVHFAQTHFGKENIHVTSVLCQNHRKKTKNKETKNVIISPENSIRSDVTGSKARVESLDLQLKRSGGVIRYSCSKCNAIFHEKETLSLHTSVFHDVEGMRSLVPLKQVCTPEGNKFFYCDKCSGCFHTEKALLVHSCVPFSRARSSTT